MGLTSQQSQQLYGSDRYTGWGETEAAANARDLGIQQPTPGVPPPFNFDYAGEATKAYGELGPYYTQLIQWAQGDMNKVLTRLTEDYDKGLRLKKEDTTKAKTALDTSQTNTNENIKNNALARGLYQKSLDAPLSPDGAPSAETGFGIPDTNFAKSNENFNVRREALDTNLTRYTDAANVNKARVTADTTEAEKRKELSYDEQRKQQAGDIANTRGQRAYQDYINKFSLA